MIKPKKALNMILKKANPLGTELVELPNTLGRVLAENIYSDVNLPPFDRSAMDGFAVNSKDGSKTFLIVEDIPAGKVPKKSIKIGQCSRIMTGAMLPKGADQVIMVEHTLQITSNKIQVTNKSQKSNVSKRGEDVKKGQLILKKGTKLRPQEAAMLATVGKTLVRVTRKPKVVVLSTGSELVEPSKKPGSGKIRNSNSSMLLVQLKKRDIDAKYLGIARDNFAVTKKLIKKGLAQADILLLSGGVSVGDYDFVREVLKSCGVKIHFNKIAIKPGKPTVFGTKGKKLIFGLPGNPVSVLVIFELFVVPAIDQMVGRKTKEKLVPMKLLKDFQRRDSKREQYFPVKIMMSGNRDVQSQVSSALPLEFHGSAHMQALTQADGVMLIKRGIKKLKEGTIINVRSI
ncbi:MAG: molybdopterin molybdotransferase MoeA [Candidatus Margulisbacteria bacterium]|nr:molybdopterin molybdotransferase MoeA [Candidatus Margulisiibacteriota bacterium]